MFVQSPFPLPLLYAFALVLAFDRFSVQKHNRLVAVGLGLVHKSFLCFRGRTLDLFLVLLFTALVLGTTLIGEDIVLGNAEYQEQPEEIDCLETGKKGEGDILADPALVLLGFPIQLERSDSPELRKSRPENRPVDPVAQIDPNAHKHKIVRADNEGVEIIKCFGSLVNVSL